MEINKHITYIYNIYIWFNCQQSRVSSGYYLNKQKGLKDPWHSHIVVTLASLASLATATRQANLRSKCFYWALNPAALQAPYDGSSFDLGTTHRGRVQYPGWWLKRIINRRCFFWIIIIHELWIPFFTNQCNGRTRAAGFEHYQSIHRTLLLDDPDRGWKISQTTNNLLFSRSMLIYQRVHVLNFPVTGWSI